jgi:hypothetical protein
LGNNRKATFDSIEVLNGTAYVGDTVAFAVREYNTAELRVGEVVEIYDTGRKQWKYRNVDGVSIGNDEPLLRVRIKVTCTSGYGLINQTVGIEKLDRIAVLPSRPVAG